IGGFRVYPPETVERIRFIRQAQELGFSLREIEELLSLRTDPATDCADVRERAQIKLNEVIRKIAVLKGIQTALEKLIAACPARARSSCAPSLKLLRPLKPPGQS
ncbi:MAG: MerR family DNA-binding protein, partial [Nitrospinales bacterium]